MGMKLRLGNFPRCSRKRRISIIFITVVLLIVIIIKMAILENEKCPENFAKRKIDELCQKYGKGNKANGKLCFALCSGAIHVNECRIHHTYTIIIKAKWRSQQIVLKEKLVNNAQASSIDVPEREICDKLNEILGIGPATGHNHKPLNVVDGLQKELSRELGSQAPERSKLINQKEFMFLSIFKNLSHASRMYGSCGSVYAMEHVEPLSNYFPEFITRIDWRHRVKMALSILHLLRELQNTPFGPLSICDVKTSDLGLRKYFQIVIIDYDMIFTKPVLDDFISQPNCVRNEDCDFFDCKSECDVSRGRCSSRMTTNNFQNFCQKIIFPRWPERGILHGLPSPLSTVLMPLLQRCTSQEFGSYPFDSSEVSSVFQHLYKTLQIMAEKR